MSHLLVIDLPGGNDGDVLAAALALGHRYTLATADPAHYRRQSDLAPLLARAEAILPMPADGAQWIVPDHFDAVLCLQDLRLVDAARIARKLGLAVAACKPVISGFDVAQVEASDTGAILSALGEAPTPEAVQKISPWRFAAPLAPDMAATAEGRALDCETLFSHSRAFLQEKADLALIEGIDRI